MRCVLSGNDLRGAPEAIGSQAHPGDWLILSRYNSFIVHRRLSQNDFPFSLREYTEEIGDIERDIERVVVILERSGYVICVLHMHLSLPLV